MVEQDLPSWPDDSRLSVLVPQGAVELQISRLDMWEAGVWPLQ